MSRCLVTGGAGFIGSHLVDALVDQGHEVIILDSLSLGKKEFIHEQAEFHQEDIRNLAAIAPYFSDVDVVFHLAAEPRLPLSIEQPIETHEVNVTGTLNVLEAAKRADVKKFVFTSTCALYAESASLPVGEKAETNPKSPYGLHKLMGEQYTRLYSDLYELPTVSLRYFNVYGPRKLADGGYPMVIPIFLQQRLDGKPMSVVGDGEATRDYVHVSDVVRANILAWQSEVTNGDVINIGVGRQTSVNEIAALIGGETITLPPRKGELRFLEANNTKAKEVLGWEPTVTLEEGLEALKKDWGVE